MLIYREWWHIKKLTFGEFVKSKRKAQFITQQQIANKLGVSAAYISDIEKGSRYPPTNNEQLPKLAEYLKLNENDLAQFYDLAGFSKNCVPPDLYEYIMSSEIVRRALRAAKDKATPKDWQKFISSL